MIGYVFLDIDGTLTDDKVYYSSSGEELKAFNVKDGLVIAAFVRLGCNIVVVTGRESAIVSKRMRELGVEEVYQGVRNKKIFLEEYIETHKVDMAQTCYIGDDLNDLASMKLCAFKACPSDACNEVKTIANYISTKKAGNGAVREILENIAKQQGVWESIVEYYEK